MAETRDHAVVIGGSLAGQLAARVLAEHFDHVTVVESDRFPDTPTHRSGIPQSRHGHFLWTRGLELLEELFPGFEAEMCAAGATAMRVPKDMVWFGPFGGYPRHFDVTRMLTFGRSLLDWTLRQRTFRMYPGVEQLTGHEVTGLISHGNGVGGVKVRERAGSGSSQVLDADFVVDATGRRSRTPEWLVTLGYPAVREAWVDPLLGYASRQYAIPSGFDADWKGVYIQAAPPTDKHMGALLPLGGGRWVCTLGGYCGDYAPTEDEAFLDFAKSLRTPVLYEAIRDAEPITPIHGFRRTANHRCRYDHMPAWPEGFVVLGDAACTTNPIYAQGMSLAAMHAVTLRDWLQGDTTARVFQRRATRAVADAWLISTSEDQRYAETEGTPVRLWTRALNWYVSRVVAAAVVDERVCSRLLDVLALRRRPPTLFLPSVLARVITIGANADVSGSAEPAR